MSVRFLLTLLLLVTVSSAVAQFRITNNSCQVRVVVVDRGSQAGVADATVQLLDAVGGGTPAQGERNTDRSGYADFQSWTGRHQVRIYSPEIEEYNGEFEVSPNESFHVERIAVVRKPAIEGAKPPSTVRATVPAVRLHIPANAMKEFQKGVAALEKSRWEDARASFQAAIHLYPDYDMAYNGLGLADVRLDDKPAARVALAKAIELNSQYADANRNLARILISENKYPEALVLLKHSLETEPQNAWALTYAAYAELQAHQFGEALSDARKVHNLPHQGLANAHVIAARALEALARNQEAIEEWKLYLAEDPKGPNADRARAVIAKQGDQK
jgi:tetratricopeptide (TPR) repeat protein